MSTKVEYQVRPAGQPASASMRQNLLPLDYLAPRSWDTVCLVFSVKDNVKAIERLKTGLALALVDFRWLAGSIEATSDDLSLVTQPTDSVTLTLTHLEESISYNDLRDAGFPQDAFDPNVLMPPGDWDLSSGSPKPGARGSIRVAAFQANIIEKGIVLTLMWHQSCCDSTGMFSFVRRWAQCARLGGMKPVPAQRLSECKRLPSRPKAHAPDISREEKLSSTMAARKYVQTPTTPGNAWNPGVYSVILRFPKDKGASLLKKSRLSNLSSSTAVKTKLQLHHAILAMVYKRIMEARWRTFHAGPPALSEISLVLDLRRSPPYINIGFSNTILVATSEKMAIRDTLSEHSLPRIADAIRKMSNSVTLSDVNAASEWVERMPRPCEAALKLDSAVSLNFAAVDYRAWRVDELDFGFEPPKAFRHGNPPMNGMAMLLPGDEGAGAEVLVSLEQSSMRRLLDDWELKMYAVPVLGRSDHPLAGSLVGNDRGEGR